MVRPCPNATPKERPRARHPDPEPRREQHRARGRRASTTEELPRGASRRHGSRWPQMCVGSTQELRARLPGSAWRKVCARAVLIGRAMRRRATLPPGRDLSGVSRASLDWLGLGRAAAGAAGQLARRPATAATRRASQEGLGQSGHLRARRSLQGSRRVPTRSALLSTERRRQDEREDRHERRRGNTTRAQR